MTTTTDAPLTRADYEERLVHLNGTAKRQPHVSGVTQPSNWDVAHTRINDALDDWELLG